MLHNLFVKFIDAGFYGARSTRGLKCLRQIYGIKLFMWLLAITWPQCKFLLRKSLNHWFLRCLRGNMVVSCCISPIRFWEFAIEDCQTMHSGSFRSDPTKPFSGYVHIRISWRNENWFFHVATWFQETEILNKPRSFLIKPQDVKMSMWWPGESVCNEKYQLILLNCYAIDLSLKLPNWLFFIMALPCIQLMRNNQN